MNNTNTADINYTAFLHKSMFIKADEINDPRQDIMPQEQILKSNVCFKHLDYVENCISQLDLAISLIINDFEPQVEPLSTIPDITIKFATSISFEKG